MFLSENILAFLFATTATIAATLTGLIGAFSTFRLQNIQDEAALLMEAVRHRKTPLGTLDEWIYKNDYSKLRKIYDFDESAIETLGEILKESGLSKEDISFEFDLSNINHNYERYRRIKNQNILMFIWSLVFVLISLALLVLTNFLLSLNFVWVIIGVYFAIVSLTFFQFIQQIKALMIET